jgi:DNA-binding transcriptional LysR family regulator
MIFMSYKNKFDFMRIDPQRLIRLAVLIQQGSFRRAADQLSVTQPALSQSIAQMESEVGAKLIERTPHGIEPTLYGQVLYEHAKAIDRELATAAQRLQELTFGQKGALTIGITPGAAASLVVLAICRLPGIDAKLLELSSIGALHEQLAERKVDLLICQRPNEDESTDTRAISLFHAKRMACIRSDHPLTGDITMEHLTAYPFVCPQEELGTLFGFHQLFQAYGLALPKVIFSNSLQIAKEMVLNSDAFALFSDLSVLNERKQGLIRMVELTIPTDYWMQLIVRAEQTTTELMSEFVDKILDVCYDLDINVHSDAKDFQRVARRVRMTRD